MSHWAVRQCLTDWFEWWDWEAAPPPSWGIASKRFFVCSPERQSLSALCGGKAAWLALPHAA